MCRDLDLYPIFGIEQSGFNDGRGRRMCTKRFAQNWPAWFKVINVRKIVGHTHHMRHVCPGFFKSSLYDV